MTILEHAPTRDDLLTFIDDSIRHLREAGSEARFIVLGPAAYHLLRKAVGERFRRGAGSFETYQYLPIVVDPFRSDTVCVLPAPSACAEEAAPYRLPKD